MKEKRIIYDKIKNLLIRKNAIIVAHYYTHPEIQFLAEITGGCVADSLEMAKFGKKHVANVLLVVGVRFMGETAKILNPEKTVLMPTLKAECSLDISCPEEKFKEFCSFYPDRVVVVYANTSAFIKACSDWVVTSSIAVKLIDYLNGLGKKIIWAPDYNLGNYIQKKTGADMLCWHGTCIVHDEFKLSLLLDMKKIYPDSAVLVHPESPANIIEIADVVGSTSQLISSIKLLDQKYIIVATERGIFYKMKQIYPNKIFLEAPTAGTSATCYSCAKCPWMAMNNIYNILQSLEEGGSNYEIKLDSNVCKKAAVPLNRMLSFVCNKNNYL